MSMSVEAIEKVEILPMNPPPNSSYSFKNGNPIVQFVIASADKLLLGSSLRLNGTLRVNEGDSKESTPVLANNGGDPSAGNGNKGGARAAIALSSRVGVHSTIQQITLSNQANQSLEVVRNYGRYLASVLPSTHSQLDMDSNLACKSLNASRKQNGAVLVNNDVGFSIPLLTGMLNSANPIPLGQNGIRGMMIQLELAPDQMVLSGYEDSTGTGVNNATDNGGAFYQLRDLSLTYDLVIPDESGRTAMGTAASGAFQYNSVQNLYSVINSSDTTQALNLGTSNTLSVIHNFIPTTHINNYEQDSFATETLLNQTGGVYNAAADIKEVSYMKSGVKFPLDYEIDTEIQSSENRPLTLLKKEYNNAIKPINLYNHSLQSLNTDNGLPTKTTIQGNDKSKFTDADPDKIFGLGVNFDPVSRVGVDYKTQPYSVRIRSNLNGSSPNSIYTYTLAKNTLSYSPNGVMVSS